VKYGVTIREAHVADSQLYWRVIGVHQLLGTENQGNHNILVEALDEQGKAIRQDNVFAASTWEGRQDWPDVTALDKVEHDPICCDFLMGKDATYSVWMKGEDRSSMILQSGSRNSTRGTWMRSPATPSDITRSWCSSSVRSKAPPYWTNGRY
jgi:hypothetical protein